MTSSGGSSMHWRRYAGWTTLSVCCLTAAPLSAQVASSTTLVDVGGHRLNVRVAGPLRPGVPTVVFESGSGSLLQSWAAVQSEAATMTRTVTYERAGIGASEPGVGPRTIKNIVNELRTLLTKVEAPPPYVLVGHSYGGAIINLFAATFPGDVAGLIHVDPTDFMQNEADMLSLAERAGVQNAREFLARSTALPAIAPAGIPSGMLAELREIVRAQSGGFADFRSAGDAPDVPLVVLLAGKRQPIPPAAAAAFPGDFAKYREATLEQRIEHFGRLVARVSNGSLVLTTKSGHNIHATEPELVLWAIRRVLPAAK